MMTPGMREIVGVVADVKHGSLQGAAQPEIYFAQSQMPMSAMTVVVRAAGDPRALQRSVRGVVQSLDRNAPVYAVRTVEEVARPFSGDAALQHGAAGPVRGGRA